MKLRIVVLVLALAAVAFGAGYTCPSHPTPLPAGFTIQYADHITYVCSMTPVYCTGNRP
jgi:hypothetical protein